MQVTVEDVTSVKKVMHIEIPQEVVDREFDKAYGELKRSAKIKGFRPGKAPRSVLERMFKKEVQADVSSRLIQSSFSDALRETQLKIVGSPDLDPPELNAGAAYRYTATVEVSPEIADIDFKGLKLKRTRYEVSDREVEAQLGLLQKNMAKLEPVKEDRGLKEGDFALIDYEGFKNGKPFAPVPLTQDFTLKVGQGAIRPEFDEQLIGLKAGDTTRIKVAFPEDYPGDELAGQEVDFMVVINEIREEKLPPIDDELAKKAGNYETLEALKEAIVKSLREGYEKRAEQELNEQIFAQLLARCEFEVPEALVKAELEGIIAEAERSFAYRNTSLEEQGISREAIAEKYRPTALKQVQRFLLLGKIIEQENLELSDAELAQALEEMAANFNQPLEEVKGYYRQFPDRLDQLKHALLEKKAMGIIIESSQIEDVQPEPGGAQDEPPAESA